MELLEEPILTPLTLCLSIVEHVLQLFPNANVRKSIGCQLITVHFVTVSGLIESAYFANSLFHSGSLSIPYLEAILFTARLNFCPTANLQLGK